MAAAISTSSALTEPQAAEQRFLLHGVPWWTYVALRDALDQTGIRMTYSDGELELMSPSELHEESKRLLGRLLEAWAEEKDVDLRAFGSTTFRAESEKRGLEPDECYTLGPKAKDAPPHLAIEIVVGSPLLDELAVYAGLNVLEVWRWRPSVGRVEVLRLTGGEYQPRERSELLPELDLELLARFVRPGESHTHAVRAYRAALRGSDPLLLRVCVGRRYRQVNEKPDSVVGVGRRRVNGSFALPVSSVPGPGPPPPSGSNVPPMAIVYVCDPTWNAMVG